MISTKTIEAKFKRAGINPRNTLLWRDVPIDLKLKIQANIKVDADESIIISFYQSPHYYLLFTTNSLIVSENYKITKLDYKFIDEIKLNDIFDGDQSKAENELINVFLKSGASINIKVEKGTWHIIFSILKLLILR